MMAIVKGSIKYLKELMLEQLSTRMNIEGVH
jgi:hypothetical protein